MPRQQTASTVNSVATLGEKMAQAMAKINVYSSQPFTITVERPKRDSSSSDLFCRISSKETGFKASIFGVTHDQAINLSLKVVSAYIADVLAEEAAKGHLNTEFQKQKTNSKKKTIAGKKKGQEEKGKK
jgi:hypothetical protein